VIEEIFIGLQGDTFSGYGVCWLLRLTYVGLKGGWSFFWWGFFFLLGLLFIGYVFKGILLLEELQLLI